MNEKLRNGEDLSISGFTSVEDISLHQDSGCYNLESGINKRRVAQFNTPLLKSLSNTSHSPSLFSPTVIQGYNDRKGDVIYIYIYIQNKQQHNKCIK